jgi:hypothetical protein
MYVKGGKSHFGSAVRFAYHDETAGPGPAPSLRFNSN